MECIEQFSLVIIRIEESHRNIKNTRKTLDHGKVWLMLSALVLVHPGACRCLIYPSLNA